MKYFLYLLIAMSTISISVNAQGTLKLKTTPTKKSYGLIANHSSRKIVCGSAELHKELMQTDTAYQRIILQNEATIQDFIDNEIELIENSISFSIPIVVHVLEDGNIQVTDEQIKGAIIGANRIFRNYWGLSVETNIQFCLANTDPQGNYSTGIIRVDGTQVGGYDTLGVNRKNSPSAGDERDLKDLSRWPTNEYYNIWIVNNISKGDTISNVSGFAYKPTTDGSYNTAKAVATYLDGAMISAEYFKYGDKTLAHELGHAFNLFHTFENACTNVGSQGYNCFQEGDYCCDTAPHDEDDDMYAATSSCGSSGTTWENSRFNVMSYNWPFTDSLRFSDNQELRMVSTVYNLRQGLHNNYSGGCNYLNILDNDNPCQATSIQVTPNLVYKKYHTITATKSAVPSPSCDSGPVYDVWFSAIVPPSGYLIIKTRNLALVNANMSLYEGTCGSLTELKCATGGQPSIYQSGLTPGSRVYIRLWKKYSPGYTKFNFWNYFELAVQDGCRNWSLSSNSRTYLAGTFNGSFNVNSYSNCVFTAVPDQPWINVNTSGNVVSYSGTTNCDTVTRTGKINIIYNNSVVETFQITQYGKSNPLSVLNTQSNATCYGSDDGSATIASSSGSSPFQYLWSTGATTASINKLSAGVYTCMVTDANFNCAVVNISVGASDSLFLTYSVEDVKCNGDATGEITMNAIGGSGTVVNPTVNDTVDIDNDPTAMAIKDDHVYIVSWDELEVIDISDPGNLSKIGSTTWSFYYPSDLKIYGDHVYITDTGDDKIKAYDISNPHLPNRVGHLNLGNYPGAIAIKDSIAFVCESSSSALKAVDISDPTNMSIVSSTLVGQNLAGVEIYGDHAFVISSNSMQVIDISDPQNPVTVGAKQLGLYPAAMTSKGQYAYISYGSPYKVEIYDLSNFSNPPLVGSVVIDQHASAYVTDATVQGNYLYLTTEDVNNQNAFEVIDISSPGNPMLVTTLPLPWYDDPKALAVKGDHAFISIEGDMRSVKIFGTDPSVYDFLWSTGDTVSDLSGLPAGIYTCTVSDGGNCTASIDVTVMESDAVQSIVDTLLNVTTSGGADGMVSLSTEGGEPFVNYYTPNLVGSISLDGSITKVVAKGNIVYAVSSIYHKNFYILDVSNQASPDTIASLSLNRMSSVSGLAVGSDRVLIANQNKDSLIVINVSDLGNPYFESSIYIPSPLSMSMAGNIVYVIDGSNDILKVYDLSVANSPSLLKTVTVSQNIYESEIYKDYLYICGNNTLQVIDISDPANTQVVRNVGLPTSVSYGGVLMFDGDNMYVSGGSSTMLFDIEDPKDPIYKELIGIGFTAVSKGFAYKLNNFTWTSSVAAYDIRNASSPVLSGSFTLPSGSTYFNLTLTGDHAIVTMQSTLYTLQVKNSADDYIYQWSNGSASNTISNLSAGTYTCTVTDANSCVGFVSVTIIEDTITINTQTTSAIDSVIVTNDTTSFCQGSSAMLLAPLNAGYSYQWLVDSAMISGADQGFYVADQTGTYSCIISNTQGDSVISNQITVNAHDVQITHQTLSAVSCNGGADGQLVPLASGGIAPYSFLWNDGSTASARYDLGRGTYTITVTDANGCEAQMARWINSPPQLHLFSGAVIAASCNTANDGIFTVTAIGGTAPYSFLWSDGSTMEDRYDLGRGVHTVTVTDANGCSKQIIRWVNSPPALRSFAGQVSPASCFTSNDGVFMTNTIGGTPPYTYLWSDGGTTQNRTDLSRGTWGVTITDANGCSNYMTRWINSPSQLGATVPQLTPASCYNSSDGVFTTATWGGVQPYTYMWSDGATSKDRFDLGRGVHTVTITDASGCTKQMIQWIGSPANIAIAASVNNPTSSNASDGSATANASAGVPPYTYMWSNGQQSQTATGLATGMYTVTVTDNNGCTNSVGVYVGGTARETLASDTDFEVEAYPNPNDGQFSLKIDNPKDQASAQIVLRDMRGATIRQMDKYLPMGESVVDLDISEMANGMYMLQVQLEDKVQVIRVIKK